MLLKIIAAFITPHFVSYTVCIKQIESNNNSCFEISIWLFLINVQTFMTFNYHCLQSFSATYIISYNYLKIILGSFIIHITNVTCFFILLNKHTPFKVLMIQIMSIFRIIMKQSFSWNEGTLKEIYIFK